MTPKALCDLPLPTSQSSSARPIHITTQEYQLALSSTNAAPFASAHSVPFYGDGLFGFLYCFATHASQKMSLVCF